MKKYGILLTILALCLQLSAQQKYQKGGFDRETADMVKIPEGHYQPFLKVKGQGESVKIHAFYLDRHAVTNSEFLAFVKANPQWTRSRVSRLFADENYLKHWMGDFKIGDSQILNSPVTNVSWFAATAYAKWRDSRLPTMEEWEYAAASPPVAIHKGQKLTTIVLEWYSRPMPSVLPNVESTFKNQYGLYDMHGLVWEWVYDFNRIITGGDSRGSGSLDNNFFCAAGALKAANKEDYASFMRFAFRESLKASYTVPNLGFRCARDVR